MQNTAAESPKKKILITGGTKGLGLEIARQFATDGAEVFVTYRSDEAAAQKAVAQLRGHGASRAEAIQVDLSQEGAADRLFDDYAKRSSALDVYIHNAAATAFKPLTGLKSHHIDKTFNITVKSFILGMQRAAQVMSGGGAVVTISGMDTTRAVPMHGLLAGAKSALETLTAYFAHELAFANIRVNCVNPGFFPTESTRIQLGESFEAVNRMFVESVPFRRMPELAEIAAVVVFLCSERAKWVVGQTIRVDGGLSFQLNLAGS